MPLHWTGRYVGLPFRDGGRDFSGVDCWGLVRLVLDKECGIELPTYAEIGANDLSAIAGMTKRETASGEQWIIVAPPSARQFDVALMHRRRAAVHVGIVVAGKRLLHIERAIDAVLLPIDHPTLQFRDMKFFRHRALC